MYEAATAAPLAPRPEGELRAAGRPLQPGCGPGLAAMRTRHAMRLPCSRASPPSPAAPAGTWRAARSGWGSRRRPSASASLPRRQGNGRGCGRAAGAAAAAVAAHRSMPRCRLAVSSAARRSAGTMQALPRARRPPLPAVVRCAPGQRAPGLRSRPAHAGRPRAQRRQQVGVGGRGAGAALHGSSRRLRRMDGQAACLPSPFRPGSAASCVHPLAGGCDSAAAAGGPERAAPAAAGRLGRHASSAADVAAAAPGGAHGSGRGRPSWQQQAGTYVRTVRTVRRSSRRAEHSGGGGGGGGGAAAVLPAGASSPEEAMELGEADRLFSAPADLSAGVCAIQSSGRSDR